MEGCRNPELNPFQTIELITLKMICKADFYELLLTASTAGNFYFLIGKKLTLSEGGGSIRGWEENEMALIR